MNAVTGFIIAYIALSAQSLPSALFLNGVDAPDGLYPYQVSLRDKYGAHFCSGAIINNRYIITTAGCIVNHIDNPYNVYVGMGSNYLNESSVTIRAVDIIVHAGYNEKIILHDIGLIQLSEDIKFNDSNIQPIALATVDRDYDNYPLVITGWGQHEKSTRLISYSAFNHLQEIIVKEISRERCRELFLYEFIKKTHICTFTKYVEGMCTSERGNPVVADGILVGIVSYSRCGANFPDVSTKIFHYRTWIEYHTGI
ncbi:chymotrypsin-2-like [Linepithema humile]|uniref:chymotrypsin-2-like n=1 Tax=Linepithema humile TaxID=83485 RepID=UPI00351E045A